MFQQATGKPFNRQTNVSTFGWGIDWKDKFYLENGIFYLVLISVRVFLGTRAENAPHSEGSRTVRTPRAIFFWKPGCWQQYSNIASTLLVPCLRPTFRVKLKHDESIAQVTIMTTTQFRTLRLISSCDLSRDTKCFVNFL